MTLREHLLHLITDDHAHASFEKAVENLPSALRGKRPEGIAHSAWEIVEHMRIAQWDLLEYGRDPKHVSPAWPNGYWPEKQAPDDDAAWEKSIAAFCADRDALAAMVGDESKDPLAPFAHAPETSIMGRVLLAADHNAYHIGQLVTLRQLLGAWK